MFWLIIAPVLAIVAIYLVANFFFKLDDRDRKQSGDKEDRNIYHHTVFREKD